MFRDLERGAGDCSIWQLGMVAVQKNMLAVIVGVVVAVKGSLAHLPHLWGDTPPISDDLTALPHSLLVLVLVGLTLARVMRAGVCGKVVDMADIQDMELLRSCTH